MPAYSKLVDIEMLYVSSLSRSELLEGIRECADDLPAELQERGEDESIDRLRLVLYAGHLIHALRQMPRNLCLGAMHDA
jgi:hypothetical protein